MKAIVLSDSHKDFNSIMKILEKEKDADYIIHAGDVHRDVEDIMCLKPRIPCVYVIGNNDPFVFGEPNNREFTLCNRKIFLTHGHLYGVKTSLYPLKKKAKEAGADICIFGHTHVKYLKEEDGIWYLNPGCTRKSYGVIEFLNEEIMIKIVEF